MITSDEKEEWPTQMSLLVLVQLMAQNGFRCLKKMIGSKCNLLYAPTRYPQSLGFVLIDLFLYLGVDLHEHRQSPESTR